MDALEFWSSPAAVRLGDAWWIFGDPYAKERLRETRARGALAAHTELMRANLVDQIYDGTLLAIGMQISPVIGERPEIISHLLFDRPDIDWNKSTIRAFGRIYEGVKVIAAPEGAPQPRINQSKLHKARGRPPVGDQLREVVRQLSTNGRLDGISRKEQENRVRALAREQHPNLFPQASQPSRNKILEALKAEGFSAEPQGSKSL